MDKFGLFDLISKLSSNESTINSIAKIVENAVSNKENVANKDKSIKKENLSKPKYNSNAIQEILKRHQEISKKIDEEYKKWYSPIPLARSDIQNRWFCVICLLLQTLWM